MRSYLAAARRGLGRFPGAGRALHLPAFIPIAAKLTVVFALLIASGMIALGVLFGTNQGRLLAEQIDRFGSTVVQQVADTVKEPLLADDTVGLELTVNQLLRDDTIRGAAIFGDDGSLLTRAGAVPPSSLLTSTGLGDGALHRRELQWGHKDADGERSRVSFLAPIRYQDLTAGYALVTFDHSVLDQARSETVETVTTTVVLMLIMGLAASIFLGARLTRPLQRLLDASRAIAEGRFDADAFRNDRRNDEIGVLMNSLNAMGRGLLRKSQVEQVFSRYVSPQVAQRVLADLDSVETVTLGGQHVQASVVFADIVGFTSLSETMPPQEVNALLNEYFTTIGQAVHYCHGHIDKYMGDCAMVVFGVPEPLEDHAFDALACAWMVMQLVEALNHRRRTRGLPTVQFRIGVNSGLMLAGNMGSAERMDYTVVGDAVNLASRLCHAAEPGQVVFTEEMRALPALGERIVAEEFGTMKLRGKSTPVRTYRLLGVNDEFGVKVLNQTKRILDSHNPLKAA